jgi:pyruvate,water dikinase
MKVMSPDYTIPLDEVTLDHVPVVGGKSASLGEMIGALGDAGVRVPGGFALTVDAFHDHLEENGLESEIFPLLDELDVEDVGALAKAGEEIRERIFSAPLPPAVAAAARTAYGSLSRRSGTEAIDVAVRSSATAEDLPTASFAGQQETFLNVRGWSELDRAIRGCIASLFTDRAIVYRTHQGIAHRDVALSVCIQKMVRSDLACAGVLFTLDTESGFRDVVLINAAFGLGELVVQGRVIPDEYWVHKGTLAQGHRPIVRKERGEKSHRMVYGEGSGKSVSVQRVSEDERELFALSDDDVLELARMGVAIEEHYSKRAGRPVPMDIEWGRDGPEGPLYILQARPETVHSQAHAPRIERFRLREKGNVLVRGKSVGSRVGAGPVRLVRSTRDLATFREGDVLVAEMTDPDWEPVLARAAAVVTDRGGRTCHAAIVSRELGIPCVVGAGDATRALADGAEVTVSCAEGDEGRVYEGRVPFDREEIDPAELPEPPVPLMLNLANPELAFRVAQLPCAGVGLMRIEFLVSSWIGVHPLALLHPERVDDPATRAEVLRRAAGFETPGAFFVERLASGIAQIAAAFHPRPVIVRFSDFKTNEYAGLLGGAPFEPHEDNPMIGFRGASRYYDERYRDGFALECRAIRRVRADMGLTNVQVMVPFCRTLEEGRRVLEELDRNGLRRGEDELKIWVMCEIPNNVVQAEEFSELFDGFSIGSNDLTQLTLGVDRDSELLAHLFDERDPGVKRMIEMVVEAAHLKGSKVGICGQAPSDYPDFAAFLVELGIDSISLNPDSIAPVARRLAGLEARPWPET